MKKLVIANWKMYLTYNQSQALAKKIYKINKKVLAKKELVVCPDFLSLVKVKEIFTNKVTLGAQNCFWLNRGPYTGEVSGEDLKKIGCKYCLVGHSERRIYFNETDDQVNQKVRAVLANGLIPVICLGETAKQRKTKQTEKVVKQQLNRGLQDIKLNQGQKIVVAYEPIWSISGFGGKEECSPEESVKIHKFIKNLLIKKYPKKSFRIIYGGSVDKDDAKEYLKYNEIEGVLVGGASTSLSKFFPIIKAH